MAGAATFFFSVSRETSRRKETPGIAFRKALAHATLAHTNLAYARRGWPQDSVSAKAVKRSADFLDNTEVNMETPIFTSAARMLLKRNTQTFVRDGRTYRFTAPSSLHPFQWLWDSCFHAIVWTHFDGERAKDELKSLLLWQRPDGFIPHVIFWDQSRVRRSPWWWHYWETLGRFTFLPGIAKPQTSAFTQPPVLAQAVKRIVDATDDLTFLDEMLPALERFYRWFAETRDPDHDGLLSTITQFESGLDFSPAYDASIGFSGASGAKLLVRSRWPEVQNKILFNYDARRILQGRSYPHEDVLLNSIYVQGLQTLARLATIRGKFACADWAHAQAHRTTQALLSKCYDAEAGLFWNLFGKNETPSKVKTVISLMPLILPDLPRPIAERLVEHIKRSFWPEFPIPTTATDEPSYRSDNRMRGKRFSWRGATTMNINWFLAHGLRAHTFFDLGDELATRSRRLVERSGFTEFYDSRNGAAAGATDFGWATLAIDM